MTNIMDKKISEITDEETRMGQYFITLKSAYRTKEGDPEKLIDLVKAAMGKRSQRKFAEDLGVNVSSISRILSGKVSEVGDTLLAKIAANADPNSGVTLEALMDAQGMVIAESRAQLASKFEENCRRVIVDTLLQKGYTVSYPDGAQNYTSRYLCDFEINTNAIQRERWLFEVKMNSQYSKLPTGVGSTRIWLDSAMAAYYRGENIGRVSLVVDRRAIFEQIRDRLKEVPIRDEISVILISIGTGRVLEEFVAPMTDGRVPEFTFKNDD